MMSRVVRPPNVRIAAILALFVGPSAFAQERPGEASESLEEHFHRNEIALVLASTYEAEEGENLFTLGFEYERKFTPRLGASGAFEHLSEVGAWVFVFPATFRIWRGLELLAGPGFEHVSRRGHGEGEEDGEAREGDRADNLFLFRIGASYSFELGERYAIVPGIEIDFVDEAEGLAEAVVYGVNFAIAF